MAGRTRGPAAGLAPVAAQRTASSTGWLDRDCLGLRGARPASRRELAELILRYRDEQAAGRARRRAAARAKPRFTAEQRLLILDSSLRSKDKPLGRPTGSHLSEATKRAILLLKEEHPDWAP